MSRATHRSTSRRSRYRREGPGEIPGGVFWSFGLLLPAGLLVGGIVCLLAEELFLPIYRGRGVDLAGAGLAGVGIFALGMAALVHFAVFWQVFPSLWSFRLCGIVAGGIAMVAGFVLLLI